MRAYPFVSIVLGIVALCIACVWSNTEGVFAQSTCQPVLHGAAVDQKYTNFVLVPGRCLTDFDKRMPLGMDPKDQAYIANYFPTSIGPFWGEEYYKIPVQECAVMWYLTLCGHIVQCINVTKSGNTTNPHAYKCALFKQLHGSIQDITEQYRKKCTSDCANDKTIRQYVATSKTGSGYIPPPQCTKREDAKVVGWFCRYIPKDRHKPSEWVYVILDKPPLKESPAIKRAKQTNPKKRR